MITIENNNTNTTTNGGHTMTADKDATYPITSRHGYGEVELYLMQRRHGAVECGLAIYRPRQNDYTRTWTTDGGKLTRDQVEAKYAALVAKYEVA